MDTLPAPPKSMQQVQTEMLEKMGIEQNIAPTPPIIEPQEQEPQEQDTAVIETNTEIEIPEGVKSDKARDRFQELANKKKEAEGKAKELESKLSEYETRVKEKDTVLSEREQKLKDLEDELNRTKTSLLSDEQKKEYAMLKRKLDVDKDPDIVKYKNDITTNEEIIYQTLLENDFAKETVDAIKSKVGMFDYIKKYPNEWKAAFDLLPDWQKSVVNGVLANTTKLQYDMNKTKKKLESEAINYFETKAQEANKEAEELNILKSKQFENINKAKQDVLKEREVFKTIDVSKLTGAALDEANEHNAMVKKNTTLFEDIFSNPKYMAPESAVDFATKYIERDFYKNKYEQIVEKYNALVDKAPAPKPPINKALPTSPDIPVQRKTTNMTPPSRPNFVKYN